MKFVKVLTVLFLLVLIVGCGESGSVDISGDEPKEEYLTEDEIKGFLDDYIRDYYIDLYSEEYVSDFDIEEVRMSCDSDGNCFWRADVVLYFGSVDEEEKVLVPNTFVFDAGSGELVDVED